MTTAKSYLNFHDRSAPGKKTKVWAVENTSGLPLGTVYWFCSFRKYVFEPESNKIFDPGCMREVADFCETKTKEHYAQIATEKSS